MASNTSIKSSPRHAEAAKVGDMVGPMRHTKDDDYVGATNLQVERILPSGRLVLSYIDGTMPRRPDDSYGKPAPSMILYPAEDEGGRVAWKRSNKGSSYGRGDTMFIRTKEDAKLERKEEKRRDSERRRYEAKQEALRMERRPKLAELKRLAALQGYHIHGARDRYSLSTEPINEDSYDNSERQDRDLADCDPYEATISINAGLLVTLLAILDK